jgi:GxxExxY protein
LGCGFHEKVYQEALAIVLEEQNIPFEREKHLPIEFHGRVLNCDYIADFVVDASVILELKAVSEMNSVYEAQVINYLKATRLQVGLLVNFGQKDLQVKRLAANIY